MSAIGVVLLAAGLSSRMGESKLLLPWVDGRPVIRHIAERLQALPLVPVVIVTGHEAEQVRAALDGMDLSFAHNPDYARGEMLSSLQTGLRALPESVDAVLVVPGDLPLLSAESVQAVADAYDVDRIVVPVHDGQHGHPVLFPRRFWPDLLSLTDGQAPRDVMRVHPQALHLLELNDAGITIDIDTREAYENALRQAMNREV